MPFLRSERTAGDFATTADVLMEVFEEYEKRGEKFTYAACLYPTAPFVTAQKLKDGMSLLQEKQGTMLMPVVAFSFPPQRSFVIDTDGRMRYKFPEYRQIPKTRGFRYTQSAI